MGTTTTRTQYAGRSLGWWAQLGWPILAGLVGAVGVVAAAQELGPTGLGGLFGVSALVCVATAWSVTQAFDVRQHPLRTGLESAVALVVLAGWCTLSPYGFCIVLATAVVSPPVLGFLPQRLRPLKTVSPPLEPMAASDLPPDVRRVLEDPRLLHSRFEELVRQLDDVDGGRDQ